MGPVKMARVEDTQQQEKEYARAKAPYSAGASHRASNMLTHEIELAKSALVKDRECPLADPGKPAAYGGAKPLALGEEFKLWYC